MSPAVQYVLLLSGVTLCMYIFGCAPLHDVLDSLSCTLFSMCLSVVHVASLSVMNCLSAL